MNANRIMDEINDAAKKGMKVRELPIAAGLVMDDKLVITSYTKEISMKGRLTHAELLVLLEADKLSFTNQKKLESTLFTNLEPCMLCLGAAITFGVGRIVYSLESPYDGGTKLLDIFLIIRRVIK